MKENKEEKKRETNDPEQRESRQDAILSAPVMILTVACIAVFVGGLHFYINNTGTVIRLQPESRSEIHSVNDHQQDSLQSLRTQASTGYYAATTESLKESYVEVEKTTDSTRKNGGYHSLSMETDKSDTNVLRSKMDESTDRKRDIKTVSFEAHRKSSTTTAANEKKETVIDNTEDDQREPMYSLSLQENTETSISANLDDELRNKQTEKDSEDEFRILPRREGGKVGRVQTLELEPGKFYDVITRSLSPPIFEIPDFLTEKECQQLIDQATVLGLKTSSYYEPDVTIHPTNQETFKGWDYNEDGVISTQEVIHTLHDTAHLFFKQADIEQMFHDLDIDENGNGVMDLDEFIRVTNEKIVHYLQNVSKTHSRTIHRNSRHTWLHYNSVKGLNQRVASLTNLPVEVIERSEKLQVVNYGPEGHYYCHLDSEQIDEDLPCCLANDPRQCRLCRYITVLYFLNDVEEGGETAFPLADNATYSDEEWMVNMKHRCDLSQHCHQANVYIKAKRGTAIMWYNHLRDDKTGWLGSLDPRAYHGGCDVIKGQKWIANSWINIIGESRDTLVTYHSKTEPIP